MAPRLRWLLCVGILLVVVIITFISARGSDLQVCTHGPTEPCRPMQFDDAPVLACLLLAVALLIPDLRRLSVAGLVELERSVQETKVEVSEARREVAALAVAVSSRSSSSAELRIDQYVVSTDSLKDEDLEALKERARRENVI